MSVSARARRSWARRVEKAAEDIVEVMLAGRGGSLGRKLHPQRRFREVCERAFQKGCEQARPYHRFRDSGLARIEGMKVGVGFELFEQEFHLPAEAIQAGHVVTVRPGPHLI